MSDLGGKPSFAHWLYSVNCLLAPSRTVPASSFKYAAFLFLIAALLISGCARQIHRPQVAPAAGEEPFIRVLLSGSAESRKLSFEGKYFLRLEEAGYYLDRSLGEFLVSFSNGRLIIGNKKRYFQISAPATVRLVPASEDSRFLLDNTPYAGEMHFVLNASEVYLVNRVPIETYLRGVVPFEIPTGVADYKEAVFSQAIAARSYAFYHLSHPASDQFHVYSDVRDQVYQGLKKTPPLSEEAIQQTRGMVLTRLGLPAETQFHSTCGGILHSRKISQGTNGEDSLAWRRDVYEGKYNCEISPLFRWVETRDSPTLLQNLTRIEAFSPDSLQHWLQSGYRMVLNISEREADGYVRQLRVQMGGHSYRLRDYQIRQFLADSQGTPLPSNLFFLLPSQKDEDKFYIIGGGYGHGYGLCQWGAIGLALRGVTHEKILEFYYPELKIQKLY